MRSLESCSGPWVGIWNQFGHRGHMRLRLAFGQGRIGGSGSEESGPFEVAGTYSGNGAVDLMKLYTGYAFLYAGRWDGCMISGTGEQVGAEWNCSEFEMWPEGEDTTLEIKSEEKELAGV